MSRRQKKLRHQPQPPTVNPQQQNPLNQTALRAAVQFVRTEMFAGPLPPPEAFQKYDAVLPGSAERILKMAEEQGAHRRSLESTALNEDTRGARRGQVFAFILTLLTIVAGTFLVATGKPVTGTIMGGVGLAATAGVFVYGSRQRRQERQTKYGVPSTK